MYPQGLLGLDWLRAFITPIAIFGIGFFVLYLRQEGIRIGRTILLLPGIAVVALLGAKLFSLHVRGWELYEPLRYELRGGLRYPGALIAMVLLGPLLKRWLLPELPLARFLDVLAITVCFCFALVRITCLLNGVPYFPEPDAYPKAMLTLRFKGEQLRLRLSSGKMADASRRLKAALEQRVEMV